jgi:anaerobic dimethyl sulfoxide reductase subunit B (iron-sulfur subunit)
MAKQLAFYFDSSACTGCKTCQVACQDKNNLPASMKWRRVFNYGGGTWVPKDAVLVPNAVFNYYMSTACMHCQSPLCLEACPTAAISKRADGVVLIDASKCVGCRYCEWACPYGAPVFDPAAGVMTKCTFCQDLLAQGQSPACVAACPMRALDFGELTELQAKYGTQVNAVEPLPSAEFSHPSVVIEPHRHAQMSGQGTGRILDLPEEV